MNLQIHHVIRDITGSTGRAIVDAILAGQRDGTELAKLRDPHIKADTETIRKSLEGNWRPEHLFTLGQSRDLYRIYQQQIVNCDLGNREDAAAVRAAHRPRGKTVTT
jgi:transposase